VGDALGDLVALGEVGEAVGLRVAAVAPVGDAVGLVVLRAERDTTVDN